MEMHKVSLKRLHECIGGPRRKAINWGPYLSDRQWGTIREDRSRNKNSWNNLNYFDSLSTSYACGEDGLFGITDPQCLLCFAYCFHNGKDMIIKEKLFGVSGLEGNHGEDVKEIYFYLTNTANHDLMKARYIYPQKEFPYQELKTINQHRTLRDPEYELWDTDCLRNGWWELDVIYTKRDKEDVDCLLKISNRSDKEETLEVIPTVWFRNTWSSLYAPRRSEKPSISQVDKSVLECDHPRIGKFFCSFEDHPQFVFLENQDTLSQKKSRKSTSNVSGTKCYAITQVVVPPRGECQVLTRLTRRLPSTTKSSCVPRPITSHKERMTELFYNNLLQWLPSTERDLRQIIEFAYSGLLWNKQYYEYDAWVSNKARQCVFGEGALWNTNWPHFKVKSVMSMPDKWEFPWFATWDLTLHMIPFCDIDPGFAQSQVELMFSSNFISADGQLPGCEYNFDDPNPSIQGLAVLHVFSETKDWSFLRQVYPHLRRSLKWWWVRKKRLHGRDDEYWGGIYFHAGFLGLDNISIFDRSCPPSGYKIYQCDAYVWIFLLGLHCLEVALLLYGYRKLRGACDDIADIIDLLASMQRRFRHFHDKIGCDLLIGPGKTVDPLPIKSYVGLTPLLASRFIPSSPLLMQCLRIQPALQHVAGRNGVWISLLTDSQTDSLLETLFQPNSLIGPYGIRSLSKEYESNPFSKLIRDESFTLHYNPAESQSKMFGGNSNWRGPVWICMNYLFIEALRVLAERRKHKLYSYLGSKQKKKLDDIWKDLCRRIISIFTRDAAGRRPVHGRNPLFGPGGPWEGPEFVLFYEFFDGDTGRGCGASHQTGWTSLLATIAKLYFTSGGTLGHKQNS